MTSRRPCEHYRCHRQASLRGRYCSVHYSRDALLGSTAQRPLPSRILKPYRRLAKEFLRRHLDHPATKAALVYLDRAYHEARGVREKAAWERVVSLGVPSLEVLEIALSMQFARYYDPRLFATDRSFTVLLGRAVLLARPSGKNALGVYVQIKGPLRLAMGRSLINLLAAYLAGATRWVEETYEAEQKLAADLRTPFPVKVEDGPSGA